MMHVLDLFSGIGGFSLGLERTGGFRTVAFCEINPFCQRVLAKHWPGVPVYEDVRTLSAACLAADGIAVDVICGGFPCQDLSVARGSSRAGLDGERSGLWFQFSRLIGELRPRYVIVENVPGLLSFGVDRVLRALAALGYDAEWECISVCAVGAPHIRERFWLVGYPNGQGKPTLALHDETPRLSGMAADPGCHFLREQSGRRSGESGTSPAFAGEHGSAQSLADADSVRLEVVFHGEAWKCAATVGAHIWTTEPDVGRVAYGIPDRVDRLRGLGNAVVPQIPEMIGRAILAQEGRPA